MIGQTVIGLEQKINDAVLGALKKQPLKNLSIEEDTVTFECGRPRQGEFTCCGGYCPSRRSMSKSINVVGSTLEDTYLKLVRK